MSVPLSQCGNVMGLYVIFIFRTFCSLVGSLRVLGITFIFSVQLALNI